MEDLSLNSGNGKNADQFWINITERVARWLSLNSSASGTQTRSYQYSYVVRRVFRPLSSIYDGAFLRKWLTNCSRRLFSQTNSRTNAWQGLNTTLSRGRISAIIVLVTSVNTLWMWTHRKKPNINISFI